MAAAALSPPSGGWNLTAQADLRLVLEDSRSRGFLGPGPIEVHLQHSAAFCTAMSDRPVPRSAVDLGSGGGIPAFVVAACWPDSDWSLVEAQARRVRWLESVVAHSTWCDRMRVIHGRAEEVARGPLRGRADLVVARSFGPPAVVAECAAPLLCEGGHLLVSDPPDGGAQRWPSDGLARLGLVHDPPPVTSVALTRLRLDRRCPDRFPRRVGVPRRRPLWVSAP